MPLTIPCPQCQRALNVPDEAVGQMVRCPACRNTFVLERPTPSAPPTPRQDRSPAPPRYEDDDRDRRRNRYDEDERDDDDDLLNDDYYPPHRGGAILALGILALCLFFLPLLSWILGGIAVSMANGDLLLMARRQLDPSGKGQTQAGKTCATLAVILSLVWFALICFVQMLSRRRF